MAEIVGYNWDLTPIYGLPNVVITPEKGKKNTYAGPYNHDYYNAQNGTAFGTSWNEIQQSIFGTPNKSDYFGKKPDQPRDPKYMQWIIALVLVGITIFFMLKK